MTFDNSFNNSYLLLSCLCNLSSLYMSKECIRSILSQINHFLNLFFIYISLSLCILSPLDLYILLENILLLFLMFLPLFFLSFFKESLKYLLLLKIMFSSLLLSFSSVFFSRLGFYFFFQCSIKLLIKYF